jgi:hypothetical protein
MSCVVTPLFFVAWIEGIDGVYRKSWFIMSSTKYDS